MRLDAESNINQSKCAIVEGGMTMEEIFPEGDSENQPIT